MDELRVNVALAELQGIIASLTQRSLNLAGDLAAARAELTATKGILKQRDETARSPAVDAESVE